MADHLIDSKCRKALDRINPNLTSTAEKIARLMEDMEVPEGVTTLTFLKEDEEADEPFIAQVSIIVKRVGE